MSLAVIGAGFGRTGTLSLKAALERLGFAPCDHMMEVFLHPERAPLWMEAVEAKAQGVPFDWERLYGGYRATTDWPGAYFWRELAAAYPEAKVILSVRDPERWYESVVQTIYAARFDPEVGQRVASMLGVTPDLAWMPQLVDAVAFDGTFAGRFADRAYAIEVFNQHIAEVVAEIPAERLLIFEARDGWEPLCKHLEVPVPEGEPFPHLNDAAAFEARTHQPGDDELMRQIAAG
jgi:hypothetical protein